MGDGFLVAMILLIVGGTIIRIVRIVHGQPRYGGRRGRMQGDKILETLESIERRLDKMEDRTGNLETIVLETEKERRFDRAL